jgi:glutamate dehydrogenase
MPVRDVWERNVCNDLQADMQRAIGQLVKKILLSQVRTCSGYFELPVEKQRINHYRRIYLEIQIAPPINLLPYVTLIRELGNLITGN